MATQVGQNDMNLSNVEEGCLTVNICMSIDNSICAHGIQFQYIRDTSALPCNMISGEACHRDML